MRVLITLSTLFSVILPTRGEILEVSHYRAEEAEMGAKNGTGCSGVWLSGVYLEPFVGRVTVAVQGEDVQVLLPDPGYLRTHT